MDKNLFLVDEEIQKTIENLYHRINERFPGSGLAHICKSLLDVSRETEVTIRWIAKPNYTLRVCIALLILLAGYVMILSLSQLNIVSDGINISDFVQLVESGLNGLVLIGAGIVFLVTFENRTKRKRVISAINRLRDIAHVIDMHQLTKDPDGISKTRKPTEHSPERTLTRYELGRYLNYCSEMLSLLSKTSFLYIQNYPDPVATDAVNDVENLTTDLSMKIWQKIVIIKSIEED